MTSPTGALQAFSNALADTVEAVGRAVVAVDPHSRSTPSGVLWREGVVVTADHLLKRDDEITVTVHDGRTMAATLAGRDPGTDLAVLRVADVPAPDVPFGDAQRLKVGHLALALARPGEHGLSASLGTVCNVGGPWRTWRGGQIDRLIRLDLSLFAGFSGGALVDTEGRIVGINTAALSRSTGIAIPAATVDRVVDQLLATGRVARGYLGIGMQPVRLPDSLRATLNLPGTGAVIVVNLEAGSPAEHAGVLLGDVFVGIDGHTVGDTEEVLALLTPERVGKSLPVQIVRGGQRVEVSVIVGERPRRGA
ncbi:S1C family serine protease [Gloeobacter morelensis]|uniref:Trypsin-like peptidase domain-containing protein n=1 Tax=Gloeobacter morelensis MG652769 TaxID=2781736 RepID=A0ABY3PQT8_9CYAN|nr:trypsin-like peptidase domain-containing protein [Gloeobacter morelensis]UFP96009.1 trypsin-like peptidase domain-containing protein [Gloeobacter morelensis MG652769]